MTTSWNKKILSQHINSEMVLATTNKLRNMVSQLADGPQRQSNLLKHLFMSLVLISWRTIKMLLVQTLVISKSRPSIVVFLAAWDTAGISVPTVESANSTMNHATSGFMVPSRVMTRSRMVKICNEWV